MVLAPVSQASGDLTAVDTTSAGRGVDGWDRVWALPPAGAVVNDYRNAGYSLRRVGDEVHIEVDVLPLESRTGYRPPSVEPEDAVGQVAYHLVLESRTHYEASSRILNWVARNIMYNLDRTEEQGPEAVLRRRSGYCTGVAKLTVALLDAVRIEAREVAGYVLGEDPGQSRGYHRWVEIFLPDVGWVFSDPLVTHHYVPANYLRLGSDGIQVAEGLEGLLLERTDGVREVDLYLGAPGIRARRNAPQQLAAALQVLLPRSPVGIAILESAQRRWTHHLSRGETTFVGLRPGSYRLRILVQGRVPFEREVELMDNSRTALYLPLPSRVGSESPPATP